MAQKKKKPEKLAKKKKFTFKQAKWLKNFLKTGNAAEAVRKAGYKPGSKGGGTSHKQKQHTESVMGAQNLAKLGKELDEYYKKQNVDVEWVLKRLVNKADRSKSEDIQLKALKMIGLNKKMFTDRLETDNKNEININIYIPDNKRDKKGGKK